MITLKLLTSKSDRLILRTKIAHKLKFWNEQRILTLNFLKSENSIFYFFFFFETGTKQLHYFRKLESKYNASTSGEGSSSNQIISLSINLANLAKA